MIALSQNSAAAAASLQSCPTLCDPIDSSPSGSTVPGILQARTLEWVAISFSNAGKWKVKVKSLSRVRPLATPWTAAHQAPWSMGFSRQYWSGMPLPSPKLLVQSVTNNGNFTSPFQILHLLSSHLILLLNPSRMSLSFSKNKDFMGTLFCFPTYHRTYRLLGRDW